MIRGSLTLVIVPKLPGPSDTKLSGVPNCGWFTTDSFVQNAPGTFGDPASRNTLRGPRAFNIDFSMKKNFRFTERWNLQFRAEAFNVLNHPQFGTPDNFVSDGPGSFGTITSVSDPRIIQLALKLSF